MQYRQAAVGDIEAIQRVARAAWTTDYPDIVNREAITETVHEWYSDDRLADDVLGSNAIVVVAEDDEIVGFAHAVWTERRGDVLRLYVTPSRREEGIGRELLESTITYLSNRGVERTRAMVLAANDAGNAFYRSAGFERVDTAETTIGGDYYEEHVYARDA